MRPSPLSQMPAVARNKATPARSFSAQTSSRVPLGSDADTQSDFRLTLDRILLALWPTAPHALQQA
jgi:hypothetical protein